MTDVDIDNHDAGELWDKSDVKVLTRLKSKGTPNADIAARMGRTVNAVKSKWYRIGQAQASI